MIRTFRDKKTEALYEGEDVAAFRSFRRQAESRLQALDSATSLRDLAGRPSNHLHAMKGDRKGQYAIRINDQWRICFEWREDGPYAVEIVDYH